jgi:hypothetical protein
MSSEELRVIPGPVIPNGVYHFKFGRSVGVGGMYLTAGRPGSQATAAALRPYPGKTQKVRTYIYSVHVSSHSFRDGDQFNVTYDRRTGGYLLRTDPQHGLSYRQPAPGQAVITSTGPPREFTIVKVAIAAEEEEEGSSIPPIRPNLYKSVQFFLIVFMSPILLPYSIGVGGGSTRLLGIGLGPETITPPPVSPICCPYHRNLS